MDTVLQTINFYTLLGMPVQASKTQIQNSIGVHLKAKLLPKTVLASAEHYLLNDAVRKQYNAYLNQHAHTLLHISIDQLDAYRCLGLSPLATKQDIALQLQGKWQVLPQQQWLLIRKWLLHPSLRQNYDVYWQQHFGKVKVMNSTVSTLPSIASLPLPAPEPSHVKWWHWLILAGMGAAALAQWSWWWSPSYKPQAIALPPLAIVPPAGAITTTVSITAVGDTTLGGHLGDAGAGSLQQKWQEYGSTYFMQNVSHVLASDDLTIANLEGPLTHSNMAAQGKTFLFKGHPKLVNVLADGSIEMVNVANNHSHDYGDVGFEDTLEALKKAGIGAFGYQQYQVVTVKGKRIGLAGAKGWDVSSGRRAVDEAKRFFANQNVDYHIMSFHWGSERAQAQSHVQQTLGRYAIDQGFNAVLGHHPHVVQGIEHYQNGVIVYSLANFVFGGNRNPSDKDSLAVQLQLDFAGDQLLSTDVMPLPMRTSDANVPHNYRPVWADAETTTRIWHKMQPFSNLDVRLGQRLEVSTFDGAADNSLEPMVKVSAGQFWCDDSLSVRATVFGHRQERFAECQPRQAPANWG